MANPETDIRPESAATPDIPGAVTATETALNNPTITNAASAIHADQPIVTELVSNVPLAISETRRGWKTSEFWGVIAAAFASLGPIDVSDKNKLLVTGLAALYAIARGLAKAGVPNASPVEPTDGP